MRRELLALGLFALGGQPSLACLAIPGPPLPGQTGFRPEIRLEEQKAFLDRTGQHEHLVQSVQYEGRTGQFAWFIPTESRPQVDVQPGAPFHELEEATRVAAVQPQDQTGFRVAGPPGTVHAGGGEFPTLRKLLPKGGTLVRSSGVLTDDQRQRDLVFDKV